MAEEQSKDSVLGGLRSRLPKFFSENTPATEMAAGVAAQGGSAARSGVAAQGSISTQSIPAVTPAPRKKQHSSSMKSPNPQPAQAQAAAPATPRSGAGQTASPAQAVAEAATEHQQLSVEEAHLQHLQYLVEEFSQVQNELQRMYQLVEDIAERESAQEKVFNTLHAELRDYKNDFIYEHLKPVIRPLLFLYDSLEQFDAEIALYERPTNGERRQSGLSPHLVRENISFFRDQLTEALRICEVAPMETPKGAFNPKLHKVIDVVPVDASQDGMIQRVVRSGWYLNGTLLRSAEVIVGKKMS